MDLSFSPEEEAFRQEVKDFIADAKPKLPKNLGAPEQGTAVQGDAYMVWHKKAALSKGLQVAPAWPRQYGGAEWSVTRRYIFSTETGKSRACPPPCRSALGMVGPVIYSFGNEAQKKKFLPRILSGADWWCQGYSEPGAGSDLASLRCRALRDGDQYVVNGQKTWTTLAQYADWDLLSGAHRYRT